MFNRILFNSEAWNFLTNKQINTVEDVDVVMLMNKIMKANVKTEREAFHLESGYLPVRFVIAKRWLMFLVRM